MIISASRRTDIPACYSDWFLRRIAEGFVFVRNPMNVHQVRRVDLTLQAVDGFVLWTKNPAPMLDKLDALQNYAYCFQFTLNAYRPDAEPGLPPLEQRIGAFQELSRRIGKERVIWRYDPILLSPKYDMQFHTEQFERLARSLAGYTESCTISFLDFYPKIAAAMRQLAVVEPLPEQKRELAARLAEAALKYGMRTDACAEEMDFSDVGVTRARCVDDERLSRIAGHSIKAGKDKNQRPACGCAASVDIGSYDTCPHGCRYCYANRNQIAVHRNMHLYDIASPLLCGRLDPGQDILIETPVDPPKPEQLRFL